MALLFRLSILSVMAVLAFSCTLERDELESNALAALFNAFTKATTFDCGVAGKDPVKLTYFGLSPDPVIYPGSVDLTVNLTLDKDLPAEGLLMKLNIVKLEPYRMTVPCFQNIGSCTYDVCGSVLPKHQEQFCSVGACKCPLKKGVFSNVGKAPMHYDLPNLGGPVIAKILQGNFQGNITFFNGNTQEEYACLGMNFAIKAKQ